MSVEGKMELEIPNAKPPKGESGNALEVVEAKLLKYDARKKSFVAEIQYFIYSEENHDRVGPSGAVKPIH